MLESNKLGLHKSTMKTFIKPRILLALFLVLQILASNSCLPHPVTPPPVPTPPQPELPPADMTPPLEYFPEDTVQPNFAVVDGEHELCSRPGIGGDILQDVINRHLKEYRIFK